MPLRLSVHPEHVIFLGTPMISIQRSARTMNPSQAEAHWQAHYHIVEGRIPQLKRMIFLQEVHANTRSHNQTLLITAVKQEDPEAFEALAVNMRSTNTLHRSDSRGNNVLHYIAYRLGDDVFAPVSSHPALQRCISDFFETYAAHLPWAAINDQSETPFAMAERLEKPHLLALMEAALEQAPARMHANSTWDSD